MKSASNVKNIDLLDRINYWYMLLKMRLISNSNADIIPWNDFEEYEYFLNKFKSNKSKLIENKVLEIGYGARPWRLMALNSLGVDIVGIDLERPTYGFNPKRLFKVLMENGFERFLKSCVRGILFDLQDLKRIGKELNLKGKKLIINENILKVGNASEIGYFDKSYFTFAFSEDVLEHVPVDELSKIIDNLSFWLEKGSIVILRPHVFTGISGGHKPEWYPHKVMEGNVPKELAWDHLLNPDFQVNTYLNKLRFKEYLSLFDKKFDVLEVKQKYLNLGENFLTADIYEKLEKDYTREELLTNQVAFVLRVR